MSDMNPPSDDPTPSAQGWDPPSGGSSSAPPPPPPPPPPPGAGYAPPPNYAASASGPATTTPWGQSLAEWWKRLVAIIIDSIIVGIVTGVLGAVLFNSGGNLFFNPGRVLLQAVFVIAYLGVMNGSEKGQTIGKMAMSIQVRDATTGGRIDVGRALLRSFVYWVLLQACVIPGIINGLSPLWDSKRQAWHDKAANSVVVDV